MHPENFNSGSDQGQNLTTMEAFKHYEIRHCIDADTLSPVYEAWDTKLHRVVAIKRLSNLGGEFDAVLKQARTAAGLMHAAFVKIHALEEVDHDIYIVMEMVQGQTFGQWMKEHQGQENLALIHIKQIAAALQEAHTAGLIHGDLQPTNLMVDAAGKIRILDLGFTTHYDPHTVKNVAEIDPQASIAYLAPERFSEQAATAASDVFALGTILYQMLLGATPFSNLRGLALVAAQAQTASDQWAWPTSVSPASRDLILGMTKRDVSKRLNWQQVQEKCQKLVVKESPSSSLSQSKIHALQLHLDAQARRRRWRYGMVLAGLLCVVVIGVWQAKPDWAKIAKALKPYAESVELAQGMKALAMYDRPGKLDEATVHFNTVLEHNPDNAQAVAGLSIVYSYRLRSNNRDDVWRGRALASAQQAISLNPDLAITQIAYALALDPHGQFDVAMAAVEKAKKIEPYNLLAWQTEMRILLLARKYERAVSSADYALNLFPNDWLLLILKGLVYFNQAKYDTAESIFRLSVKHNSDSILSYNFLAKTLDAMGRRADSLQVLQQGLQVRPDATLYLTLGQTKFSQGDFSSAAEALEQAVILNPQDYEIWRFLADALIEMPSKQKEARAAYLRARELLSTRIERRPNDGWFIAVMAVIEVRLGDFESAKKSIANAIELAPTNPVVHLQAAKVYEIMGQRANALTHVEKAKQLGIINAQIEADPSFIELRKDHRYLN